MEAVPGQPIGDLVAEQVAALTHDRLLAANEIRRIISSPPPTGALLRWRRRKHRARLAAAAWLDRPLRELERLPFLGTRVTCPLCNWEGGWFRPTVSGGRIRSQMICPGCRSSRRHRLFWLAWRQEQPDNIGTCLHMAPEAWLAPLVAASVSDVVTMDIESLDVDVKADAERLPFRDGQLNLIICNDVLEHVADDRQALRELARVLTPSGVAFMHTPVVSTKTVEYGFANLVDHGHRRAYGPDLVARVHEAGLQLSLFRSVDLSRSDRRRYGLPSPDAILIGRH